MHNHSAHGRSNASQVLPLPTHDYSLEVVEETIISDLTDATNLADLQDGGLPVHFQTPGPAAAGSRWGALVADMYADADQDELRSFFDVLNRRLGEVAAELEAESRAREEQEAEGLCVLCEREMSLTRHHLIPRWGGGGRGQVRGCSAVRGLRTFDTSAVNLHACNLQGVWAH